MFNDNLMILIPKEMKEKVKEIASKEYQTVSEYIRGLIAKDIKERG